MRARLVLPLLRRNIHVIAQARIDTAMFLPPVRSGVPRRGRPRIYGKRLDAEAVEALSVTELTMSLYGKEQRVRLRSPSALTYQSMSLVWPCTLASSQSQPVRSLIANGRRRRSIVYSKVQIHTVSHRAHCNFPVKGG